MELESQSQLNDHQLNEFNNQFSIQQMDLIQQNQDIQEQQHQNVENLILIINTLKSEQKQSLIFGLSNGLMQNSSNINGIHTFTINKEQAFYQVVQLNEQFQETQDQDFRCAVWLNTLFKKCKHLWIIITFSQKEFLKDNQFIKIFEATIELLVQFVKLDNQLNLNQLFKHTQTFFLNDNGWSCQDFPIQCTQQLKQFLIQLINENKGYKKQFVEHLITQINNQINVFNCSKDQINQVWQTWTFIILNLFQQREIQQDNIQKVNQFINQLNNFKSNIQEEIIPLIQYQLSPKTNSHIISYIQNANKEVDKFVNQSDNSRLQQLFCFAQNILRITKNENYQQQFTDLFNKIQNKFLEQLDQIILLIEPLIIQGQQIEATQLQQIQQFCVSLKFWSIDIVPKLGNYNVINKIEQQIFEEKLIIACKSLLDKRSQDLEKSCEALILIKMLDQSTDLNKLSYWHGQIFSQFEYQIQTEKDNCSQNIHKLFDSDNLQQQIQWQKDTLGSIFQCLKQLKYCSYQLPQSKIANYYQEVIDLFSDKIQCYLNNLTSLLHDLIKYLETNNQALSEDFSLDAYGNYKKQFSLLDCILTIEEQIIFQNHKTQFQELKANILTACNNFVNKIESFSFQYFRENKFQIIILVNLTKLCDSEPEQCLENLNKLKQIIEKSIINQLQEILQKIQKIKEDEQYINQQLMQQDKLNGNAQKDFQDIHIWISQIMEFNWLDDLLDLTIIRDTCNQYQQGLEQLILQQINFITNCFENSNFQWIQIQHQFHQIDFYILIPQKYQHQHQLCSLYQPSLNLQQQISFQVQLPQQLLQLISIQGLQPHQNIYLKMLPTLNSEFHPQQEQIQQDKLKQKQNQDYFSQKTLNKIQDLCQIILLKLNTLNQECQKHIQQISWEKLTVRDEKEQYICELEKLIFQTQQLQKFEQYNHQGNWLYNTQIKEIIKQIIGIEANKNTFVDNLLAEFSKILQLKVALEVPFKAQQLPIVQQINNDGNEINQNSEFGSFSQAAEVLKLIQFFNERSEKGNVFDFYQQLKLEQVNNQVKNKLQRHWKHLQTQQEKNQINNLDSTLLNDGQTQLKEMNEALKEFFPMWGEQLKQQDILVTKYIQIYQKLVSNIQSMIQNSNSNLSKPKTIITLLNELNVYKKQQQNKFALRLPDIMDKENQLKQQFEKLFKVYENNIINNLKDQNFKELQTYFAYYIQFYKIKFTSSSKIYDKKQIIKFLKDVINKIDTIQLNIQPFDENNKQILKKLMNAMADVINPEIQCQFDQQQAYFSAQLNISHNYSTEQFNRAISNKANQIINQIDSYIQTQEIQFQVYLNSKDTRFTKVQNAQEIITNFKFIQDFLFQPFRTGLMNEKKQNLNLLIENLKTQLNKASNDLQQDFINMGFQSQLSQQINDQLVIQINELNQCPQQFEDVKIKMHTSFKDTKFKIEQQLNQQKYNQAISNHQDLKKVLHILKQMQTQQNYQQNYTDICQKVKIEAENILLSFFNNLEQIRNLNNQQMQQNAYKSIDEKTVCNYFSMKILVSDMKACAQNSQFNDSEQIFKEVTLKYQNLENQLFDLLNIVVNQFQLEKKKMKTGDADQQKMNQILYQLQAVNSIVQYLKQLSPEDLSKLQMSQQFNESLNQNKFITYQDAKLEISQLMEGIQQEYANALKSNNYQIIAKTLDLIEKNQQILKINSINNQQLDYQVKISEIRNIINNLIANIVDSYNQTAELNNTPLQHLYSELMKIDESFKNQTDLNVLAKKGITEVQDKLKCFCQQHYEKYVNNKNQNNGIQCLAQSLEEIGQIGYQVTHLKNIVMNFIDDFFLNNSINIQSLIDLQNCFIEKKSQVGQLIINESSKFKNIRIQDLINLTKEQNNLKYVLDNIKVLEPNIHFKLQKVPNQNFNHIKDRYNKFQNLNLNIINHYLIQLQNRPMLVKTIQSLANKVIGSNIWNVNVNKNCQQSVQDNDQLDINDPQLALLANLTAYWSLFHIKSNLPIKDQHDNNIFQVPHATQIFTIMILLGFNRSPSNASNEFLKHIKNKLAQIKTGQGKSIILGLLAAYLALLGFQVDVVCYSQYLSQRDFQDFKDFFQELNILDNIKYSTFTDLCNQIINEPGNIRDLSLQLLQQNNNQVYIQLQSSNNNQSRKRILLIDEVDVFFSLDFYGQTYNPMIPLQNQDIIDIMNDIWLNRDQDYQKILKSQFDSQQYKSLINTYAPIAELIDVHIRMMVSAARKIDEHNYVVIDGKICYTIQGQTTSKVSQGYSTNFAYFKERQNNCVSQQEKINATCINLCCGFYSYPEAPKNYEFILGVTGTLRSLHPEIVKIIMNNKYIEEFIKIPSMFGKSKLKFSKKLDKDIFLLKDQQQFVNKIQDIAQDKADQNSAVLIFFKDQEHLLAFSNASNISTLIIDQKTSRHDLQDMIFKATTKSQIVLVDGIFGRGTDFICRDPHVTQNLGVVVIQTFLSLDKSEEKQIKGRTARQSQKGEYYLVLLQDELIHDLQINEQQLQPYLNQQIQISGLQMQSDPKETFYKDFLDFHRNKIFGNQLIQINQNLTKSMDRHKLTLQYQNQLIQNDRSNAINTLISLNKQNYHYILCLDVSGSMMYGRWDNLMNVIKKFQDQKLKYFNPKNNNDIYTVIFYSTTASIIANQISIQKLVQEINKVDIQLDGGTVFYLAIEQIYKVLIDESPQYKSYPKRILFLTDGHDSERKENGEKIGKKLNTQLQLIINTFSDSIKSWWNLLIQDEQQQEQKDSVLKEMINIMSMCGSKYIETNGQNQLEEEILNLAFYNL